MIWFTSDTHFGHANVLNFTDRRWETVEQMSSALVGAINARVAPADELYILGDFSFKMTAREAAAPVSYTHLSTPRGTIRASGPSSLGDRLRATWTPCGRSCRSRCSPRASAAIWTC